MKPHIDIMILDEDRYFALGLEKLLQEHFMHKGWSVTFLPAKLYPMANLIIQAEKVPPPLQFCHFRKPDKQHSIITIQQTPRLRRRLPACMSEHGVIRRSDSTEVVLHLIEQMFGGITTVSSHLCPHCSQTLTPREWEVLYTIRLGMLPRQVAGCLNLSVKTVSAHKRAAMRKLGFQRNNELYQWLRQGGLDVKKRELL
ncbi:MULTISPECIES: response regulator transcription factor [Serratia]|jgi:DNA-binding CsgD family transcriptional regulator|uniref:response regulator transcription factor n=1 Tax=Serratia TaxID=613 RepID=UPI00384DE806